MSREENRRRTDPWLLTQIDTLIERFEARVLYVETGDFKVGSERAAQDGPETPEEINRRIWR